MAANRHSTKIIIALVVVAVAACILAALFSDKLTGVLGGTSVKMEYESALFDTDEIIEINIKMDEDQWNTMLANALSEEYYVCDVTVNGKTVKNVAIRPKGNTSLSAIAMDPDSNRFSLKLEFDHFVEGQTCYGLDKLILNNNYADATNMKEAIVYDMYQYIGADASLYNYAKVSVNGEYWGVYLALEAVEESFMLRNFGTQNGELYKPDSMEMGGGSDSGGGNSKPSGGGNSKPSGMGGFSSGSGGANLNYTGDDLDNYSTIWEGEVTKSGKKDHRRVVTALQNISEGTDLETYLDVDNVLKYMAVHTFSVNMDSLSGSMAHNYYLYEYEGQLNIFPWDYNLSFGGMSMSGGDATSMVNDAIDTPFSATKFFDALLSNEEYLERYHAYLQQLVDEYVNGGRFEEVYNRIRSQIDGLVETDPTAFYDYEEYQVAVQTLYEVIGLRAESISGQLDGSIPSTDAGQREDSSALIDASHINVEDMGQFDMGGGFSFGGKTKQPDKEGSSESSTEPSGEDSEESSEPSTEGSQSGSWPGQGSMPEGFSGFDPGNMPEGFSGFDPDNLPEGFSGFDPGNMPGGGFNFGGGTMPDMGQFPGGSSWQSSNSTLVQNLIVFGICLAAAVAALFAVKGFKRRR